MKFLWFSLVASFSSALSLLLSSFCCCLIYLPLPEEDLMSKALVCLYHRSSSIGEYSFLVLFLTCLPHQQLLAFSYRLCLIWLFHTGRFYCFHFFLLPPVSIVFLLNVSMQEENIFLTLLQWTLTLDSSYEAVRLLFNICTVISSAAMLTVA